MVTQTVDTRRVRRSFKFSCGKAGLRGAISRIARAHGMVDEHGSPHDAEVVRLLLVTALTKDFQDHVATAVQYAVQVQRPMMISAALRRVTRNYTTSQERTGTGRKHGRSSCERRNQATITLDDWLHDALSRYAPYWQDEFGAVRDGKMVADLCQQALSDPDLPTIAKWYAYRTARLRERLAQIGPWLEQMVDAAMREDDLSQSEGVAP